MLTQQRLKELVSYNPETGEMVHLKNRRGVPKDKKIRTINSVGYYVVWLDRTPKCVHRLAFLYIHGYMPNIVDHKDSNKLNNAFTNLRDTTYIGNNQNIVKATTRNKLGLLGVSMIKKSGKYTSFICSNGVNKNLGTFDTKEDASIAYWLAKKHLHDGNFFCKYTT